MRSVVNHLVDGIISIDERGVVTTYKPAAERIFGYVADEVVRNNVKMLMPQPYHREHDGYIDNYVRTGQAKIIGIGREVVGERKGGEEFPMELAISEFPLGHKRYFTGSSGTSPSGSTRNRNFARQKNACARLSTT